MSKKKDSKDKKFPEQPDKKPLGRPSKYDPKYCQMLIDHMASGFSYESFGGLEEVSVSKQTLYDWENAYPDFLDAKKIGSQKNLMFWERKGHEGLFDQTEYNEQGKPILKKTLNSTVWIFSMKNRHKWKDRQEVEASVTTSSVKDELANKSIDELLKLIKNKEG